MKRPQDLIDVFKHQQQSFQSVILTLKAAQELMEYVEHLEAERDRYRLKYDVIRSRYKASRLMAAKYKKALGKNEE